MSRETSPDAGKPYGLERVCRVLEFPRSTIYAQQARGIAKAVPLPPVRRGPKPKISDLGLLAVFVPTWRLRPSLARAIARRGHGCASFPVSGCSTIASAAGCARTPGGRRIGCRRAHPSCTMVRSRPRRQTRWGTDGVRLQTVEDGWVGVFSAVDHCDACCVGIPAVKIGHRFAALPPIAQGRQAGFGATGANAGKGLKLRREHGTPYTADRLPEADRVPGHRQEFRLRCRTSDQRRGRALQQDTQGVDPPWSPLPQPRTSTAGCHRVQGSLPSPLASRKTGLMSPLEARQADVIRKTAWAANQCPINGGRYTRDFACQKQTIILAASGCDGI